MTVRAGVGRRIREARRAAGLSQSELAIVSGIPKARLSRYENEHVDPSLHTLRRLAVALNVNEATLLGDGIDVVRAFRLRLLERGIVLTSKDQARALADVLADSLEAQAPRIGATSPPA